jgi:lipopolysaccharide/colanic/teichoic acid biosynthesis glycosyltransferase
MKRVFDILAAGGSLVLLSPILAIAALAIRWTSGSPVIFRQIRVGRDGCDFLLCKFRTMRVMSGTEGGSFDAGSTAHVTPVGRILRKWKLDELPQLWNVLKGEMSLVGPRPEVRKWVQVYPERWALAHTVRPGITDPASIVYHDEENILAQSSDPERLYGEDILPHKLSLYESYVRTQTFWGDIGILLKTIWVVARGRWVKRDRPSAGCRRGLSANNTNGRE